MWSNLPFCCCVQILHLSCHFSSFLTVSLLFKRRFVAWRRGFPSKFANCETCYFSFDPAFVWPSLGCADFPCKPFPGLCACTRTGRRCASVVAIRSLSLSLFTNRADRRSQISSWDSWCATRVSKTLDVVHRYALLVRNNDIYLYLYICCSPLYTRWVTRLEPVSLWLPPAHDMVPSATRVTVRLVVCLSGTAVTIISLFLFS